MQKLAMGGILAGLNNVSPFQSPGAVISGRHFRNPVSLAKEIMKNSNHCALSGEGALKFAKTQNFPFCYPEQLISERYKKRRKRVESVSTYDNSFF